MHPPVIDFMYIRVIIEMVYRGIKRFSTKFVDWRAVEQASECIDWAKRGITHCREKRHLTRSSFICGGIVSCYGYEGVQ